MAPTLSKEFESRSSDQGAWPTRSSVSLSSTSRLELARPSLPEVVNNLGRREVSSGSRSTVVVVTRKEELGRRHLMVAGVRSSSSTRFMRSSYTTNVRFTFPFCYVRETICRQNFSQSLVWSPHPQIPKIPIIHSRIDCKISIQILINL